MKQEDEYQRGQYDYGLTRRRELYLTEQRDRIQQEQEEAAFAVPTSPDSEPLELGPIVVIGWL